ncbi:MAG TPA: GAF and ANTAR domain-containing protein [Nocardioides sp.]|nr:GAF and ANTAR domain-containing protein [Nocardioides sp.]
MSRVQRLCALCVKVTGVTGVAISIAADDARSTVCATDDASDRLEDLQDTLGEGPAVEALRRGTSVLVADLAASDGRWPGFTPAATDEGVRAVFVFPLRMGAADLGTLAMYRNEVGPLDDGQFRDAWVLAEAATVLLLLSSPGQEPVAASDWVLGDQSRFRAVVHQAVGVTMVQLDVGPRDAFARICAHAFATNTPIGEVAAQIVAKKLRLEPDS